MAYSGTLKRFMDGKGFLFNKNLDLDGSGDVFVLFSQLTNGGEDVGSTAMTTLDITKVKEVKEKEMVIAEQCRRIEELEASERKLQCEKNKLEMRQVKLVQKLEELRSRNAVLNNRRCLKVKSEQEIFPTMQHLDMCAKSAQVQNAALNEQLKEALKKCESLEAQIEHLETRSQKKTDTKDSPKLKDLIAAVKARKEEILGKEPEKWQQQEYFASQTVIEDWRMAEAAAAASEEGVPPNRVRQRRLSEPARPGLFLELSLEREELEDAVLEWQQVGLPPLTHLKSHRLRMELFEGLPEVQDLMMRGFT